MLGACGTRRRRGDDWGRRGRRNTGICIWSRLRVLGIRRLLRLQIRSRRVLLHCGRWGTLLEHCGRRGRSGNGRGRSEEVLKCLERWHEFLVIDPVHDGETRERVLVEDDVSRHDELLADRVVALPALVSLLKSKKHAFHRVWIQ